MENKGTLVRMFISNEWTSSKFAKTQEGKHIEEVIMDKEFQKNSYLLAVHYAYYNSVAAF
ncbi:hypothetical protein TSUD_235730 [Trifolium subterraneum]|nr:hypothetical protein TSUD_235730 [Trifolium subterraneum]